MYKVTICVTLPQKPGDNYFFPPGHEFAECTEVILTVEADSEEEAVGKAIAQCCHDFKDAEIPTQNTYECTGCEITTSPKPGYKKVTVEELKKLYSESREQCRCPPGSRAGVKGKVNKND